MKNIIILCTIFLVSICNAATYSGGTGIITSPYVIDSKADLLMLATNSGDFTKYFIMTSDIDLAGEIFTNAVIAASIMNTNDTSTGQTFSGNFNGNGHKIINLSINTLGSENDFLGLFGYIYAGGSSAETMIYNLEVQLVINTGQYSVRIGGICGYLGSGIISNCTTSVSMYLDEYNEDIGGICGHNYKGTIIDCSSSGEIDPDRFSEDIGGITGQSRVVGKVINCFSDTYIRCDDQVHRFGGIVGYNEPGCIISNCYTVGNVHSLGYSTFFGGLCGFNSGDIADSGAKCTVTASTNSVFYGGFIGRITAGIITNCYSASTIVNNGASV
ncbi:MAG: hypothetical protein KAI74_01525, partial [Kiritimatiellae bacterium]|nr:hypothetical protein [Kiritimatiellia bacterium]